MNAASPTPTQLDTRMVAAHQRSHRLDADVRGEDEEAAGDELLRAAFSTRGSDARARKEPQHDEPCERLDQRVGTESDERDRAGGDTGAERDPELHDVPADSAPGEQPRRPLELGAPLQILHRYPWGELQLDGRLGHGRSVALVVADRPSFRWGSEGDEHHAPGAETRIRSPRVRVLRLQWRRRRSTLPPAGATGAAVALPRPVGREQ